MIAPRRPPGILRAPRGSIATYATIAAGCFAASLCTLSLLLTQARKFIQLGFVGNLYYVLLVPLGLSVAAFLFGVLRSYAGYVGHSEGRSLELGGPIVAFLLVVVLGFRLVPDAQPFDVTVFVHGEGGPQDVILRNSGNVLIDLAGDRRRESIDDQGRAFFTGIPAAFRGQSVAVAIDAQGYESATRAGTIKMAGNSAYIAIRPKDTEFSGYVRADSGQPIAGATISIAGVSTQSDTSGYFKLAIRGAARRQSLTMQVGASRFAAWRTQVVPGSNEIGVVLDRAAPAFN
jgi:hypothetical protein